MTDQLAIPGAEERDLVVQLSTLTVQGRRLTRSLYNQLRREPIIGDDGTLVGVPWGYVNEHFKGGSCGSCHWIASSGRSVHGIDQGHRHIIWQRGNDLLRDMVFSPGVAEHQIVYRDLEHVRAWALLPPETIPARRRSHNLIAGLPQIFIGR